MKKVMAVLLALLMLVAWSSPADAAQLGQINLKNKTTIKAMKNGTMTFKGVKLGNTIKTAKKKWGTDYSGVRSQYQYYDYSLNFDMETDDDYDTVEAYFTGQRGNKTADYKLKYIDYYGTSTMLKYKDMTKYWGKPDFKYVSANEEVYFFGQTGLVYDNDNGSFVGYKYVDKATVKAIKKAFSK